MTIQTQPEMTKNLNEYLKAVTEWGKLLGGLNVFMGGGCLTILQNSTAQGMTRVFLVAAIIAFVFSTLFLALLMGQALAEFSNHLTAQQTTDNVTSETHRPWALLSANFLINLQFISFTFACLFLGIWVALKLM